MLFRLFRQTNTKGAYCSRIQTSNRLGLGRFKPALMFKIILKSKFNQVPNFRDILWDAFRSWVKIHHPVHCQYWGDGRDGKGLNMFGWSLENVSKLKFGSLTDLENKNYKYVASQTTAPCSTSSDALAMYGISTLR